MQFDSSLFLKDFDRRIPWNGEIDDDIIHDYCVSFEFGDTMFYLGCFVASMDDSDYTALLSAFLL